MQLSAVYLITLGNQSFTKFVGVFQVRLKMLVTILPFVFFREQVEVIAGVIIELVGVAYIECFDPDSVLCSFVNK